MRILSQKFQKRLSRDSHATVTRQSRLQIANLIKNVRHAVRHAIRHAVRHAVRHALRNLTTRFARAGQVGGVAVRNIALLVVSKHGFSTERARLAGGTSFHTTQMHTASAQNVQDQPGALRFARGFKKSACYLVGFSLVVSKKVPATWCDFCSWFQKKCLLPGGIFARGVQKSASYLVGFLFFPTDFET